MFQILPFLEIQIVNSIESPYLFLVVTQGGEITGTEQK